MLRIAHPPGYEAERHYIYRVLLADFLGLEFQAEAQARSNVSITCRDDPSGKELVVAERLFQTMASDWLTPASLPRRPLAVLDSGIDATGVSSKLPIVYGQAPHLNVADRQITLGIDVFGSAFFMLTRYEEAVRSERDTHDRFPADASLAFAAGFLGRPIVNEYVEILWACLARLWPALKRAPRRAQVLLSHDVDWPWVTVDRTVPRLLKAAAGDIVKRKDPLLSAKRLRSAVEVRRGNRDRDVGNTFDFIMDLSERHDLRSAFYFIAGHSAGPIDGNYRIADPWIRSLLRRVHERGHEIGLHPSYNTFRDAAQTRREFEELRRVCDEEGIEQPEWGGRQHYLRWENPTTWQNWEDAGLHYDSTLTFPEQVGFRSGVCHRYPAFNLRTRRPLRLLERPLIVMEVTLLGSRMHLRADEIVDCVAKLWETCRRFDGEFTLLWHNSSLMSRRYRMMYADIVRLLAG
jgi:hypothetical protein